MDRWNELLRQSDVDVPPSPRAFTCAGKNVLITGAGGYIGSALAKAVAAANPALLILMDHAEENLHRIHDQMEACFPATTRIPILGDIGNSTILNEIFQTHRPHTVFHAAAYKHVCLLETDPFAAASNNILGTLALAQSCVQHEAARLVMISTDKAVNPSSVMGASKRIAELVLLSLSKAKTRMSAVRFGNVFGSTGSVVPRFLQQIAAGVPVTVTHPDASRYFLTVNEAVELILAAASVDENGTILIPQMPPPIKIRDLANHLVAAHCAAFAQPVEIIFTGLHPGEKLTEEIVSSRETLEPTADPLLHRVFSPRLFTENLDAALRNIALSIRERNFAQLFDTICRIVPEYSPSEAVLAQLKPELA